jgi:hypothetical protein
MAAPTNYIVFLCYGNVRVFHECTYALLSLSRLYSAEELSNIEIWIYTDNPVWFRSLRGCSLPLRYRETDAGTIKGWRGKIDFVHRVKIEVLKDFVKDKSGNILYVDTDVVFTHTTDKILANINEGALYMHTMEGKVSDGGNPIFRKLNKYLGPARSINNKPLNEMMMWNAGVLGFNTKHYHLLDEVLKFTDEEYSKFPKHIVEQFAFSVYFQVAGDIKAAAPYIFHYWKLKEASYVLESFFDYFKDTSWGELTRYSSLIQMHSLMQIKVDFLHNRSLTDSILHKQWLPPAQNWAMLCKQL